MVCNIPVRIEMVELYFISNEYGARAAILLNQRYAYKHISGKIGCELAAKFCENDCIRNKKRMKIRY